MTREAVRLQRAFAHGIALRQSFVQGRDLIGISFPGRDPAKADKI